MLYEADVVSVPSIGRADIRIWKLFGDSVISDVRSAVEVIEGDRVIVADLAYKAHVHAWHILGHESDIGRPGRPYAHEHPMGQVLGLADELAAIKARLDAAGL